METIRPPKHPQRIDASGTRVFKGRLLGISMLAVVVPAHNEEALIGNALSAVNLASVHPILAGEPVIRIVVLDSCRDRTGQIARRHGAITVEVEAQNVGIARARGAEVALRAGARWLAFTDADTRVAPEWLVSQLELDADAVCGTVTVEEWEDYDSTMRRAYSAHYLDADGHRHIHGANLGVSATAYEAAGGFRALECG